jgi:hypothetical protein
MRPTITSALRMIGRKGSEEVLEAASLLPGVSLATALRGMEAAQRAVPSMPRIYFDEAKTMCRALGTEENLAERVRRATEIVDAGKIVRGKTYRMVKQPKHAIKAFLWEVVTAH